MSARHRLSGLAGLALASWAAGAQAAPPPALAQPASDEAGTPRAFGPTDFEAQGSAELLEAAPLVLGERVVAARWDAELGGVLYGAKRLYVYEHDQQWHVREWPEGVSPLQVFSLAGTQWFVGEPGALFLRKDAQHFDRKVVSGIDPRTREQAWRRAWVSPDAAYVWVLAGYDRVLRIEVESGAASVFHIPVDNHGVARGDVSLVGREQGERTQLLIAIGSSVYGLSDGEVRELARFEGPVHALAFAGPEHAQVQTEAGPQQVSLAPVDPAGERPLDPHAQRIYDAVTLSERMAQRSKTLPGAETFWFPSLRIGPAAEFRFDQPVAAFGMEIGAGMMLAPPTGKGPQRAHAQQAVEAWFWPELGYSWSSDARSLGHAAFAGVGFGLGNDFVAGYYKPRAVVGAFDRGVAPGLRHGLSVQAFWGALGVELSHGMAMGRAVPGPRKLAHDLRVGVDINLVPIFWALHLWARR